MRFDSQREIWWKCTSDKNHLWCSSVAGRTLNNENCPYCFQSKVKKSNNLAELAPELASHWDDEKNLGLSVKKVLPNISLVVHWKCDELNAHRKNHRFKERIDKLALSGFRCPECNQKDYVEHPALSVEFPKIAKQWHKNKNGSMKPSNVVSGSSLPVWWQCPVAKDHVWQTTIAIRCIQKAGCPYCEKLIPSSTYSLAVNFPELLKQWHKTKNKGKDPYKISQFSSEKVWWKCPAASDHVWQSSPHQRTYFGSGCPYCVGYAVTKSICLATTHPEIAKEWHKKKNGKLTPEDVRAGSEKKVYWQCQIFKEHVFQAPINSRTRTGVRQGTKCPHCRAFDRKKVKTLSEHYPDIAKQWHQKKNYPLTPDLISAYSNKKYWWICPVNKKHEYYRRVSSRTFLGSDCPLCNESRTSN